MKVEQVEPRTIAELCLLLGYSRQSYYKKVREIEAEGLGVDLIIAEVEHMRLLQPRLGTRKLQLMLQSFMQSHNLTLGRDKLFDLLRQSGLLIKRRRGKRPQTTFSYHWFKKHPNLIQDFVPSMAGQLWVSDITYICIGEHFSYLSLITDAYSRKIVGFYLSKTLSADGCVKALKMALKQNPERDDLIHHSDRGGQYCCADYVDILQTEKVRISMTQTGNPRHNAIAERVNGILKMELLQACYDNFKEASDSISTAITIYNTRRIHSSIDMLTPEQAHSLTGKLDRRWNNYHRKQKEVPVQTA
jgi:transposase InsO family protein